ncbi:MAG: hypothetical protein OET21_08290 [Desulfobacterales bacterium]|jgi:hypothetical protein|nr:hypothetical protein [Desulfobacterales bacterium]
MIWKNIAKDAHLQTDVLVCLFLSVLILAVYLPVKNYEFVNYDDDRYVTENVRVKNGLSLDNIIWAFKSTIVGNWHPITWLSHMLNVELNGLNPGAHHQINVIFHLFNALLLFFVFRKMTGGLWQSGFVAAIPGEVQ